MNVKMTFEFENSYLAAAFLEKLHHATVPVTEAKIVPPGPPTEDAAPKARRGRKSKTTEEQQTIPAALPEPVAVNPTSLGAVQKIVEAVFEAQGMAAARDVLARFGVQRVRDLKPEQYQGVYDLAKAVLGGNPP